MTQKPDKNEFVEANELLVQLLGDYATRPVASIEQAKGLGKLIDDPHFRDALGIDELKR